MTDQAVVVGASSQIGAAIAEELACHVPALQLWGRDRPRLATAAAACERAGAAAVTSVVEVTDHSAMRSALESIRRQGPLKVAVWVAGIFDWGTADTADPDAWRNLIEVNLTAPSVFTTLALSSLLAAAPSSLIFIGSNAGHTAFPHNAAYVASKHGLTGLARATFLDVRDRDVKVSLISPGLVAAGVGLLSPAGQERPGELLSPADVAAAVRFVVTSSTTCCPTEIHLRPLHST